MSSCFEYVGNYSNDDAAEVERRNKNLEKIVNFFVADRNCHSRRNLDGLFSDTTHIFPYC